MKIKDLFQGFPIKHFEPGEDSSVLGLNDDSRTVKEGSLFFAIRGSQQDSHKYLPQVCAIKSIAGVVVEDAREVPTDFRGAVLVVKNSRQALDHCASVYYGRPSEKLICVGVTGTNGKTTTTHFLERIFMEDRMLCGVMGTIDHHMANHVWPSSLTTPGPILLQQRLKDFLDMGAKAVAMEVSSHALEQGRVDSVQFDSAIFTNVTRDHLDYHGDMETYFQAKRKLFHELLAGSSKAKKLAVINVANEYGRRLRDEWTGDTISFGPNAADLQWTIRNEDYSGTELTLHMEGKRHDVKLNMPCRHNVENAVGAAAVAWGLGLPVEKILKGMSWLQSVAGRLQSVPNNKGIHVFVDYAHTDQALKNVLESLNTIRKNSKLESRIITVFGCGGDRDKGKRPLMGKAASEGSDEIVVTSDNPRSEEPAEIIRQIIAGISKQKSGEGFFVESDRREAIGIAIKKARPGDVVLIAGKGHESEQIIGNNRLPFSDYDVAMEWLS